MILHLSASPRYVDAAGTAWPLPALPAALLAWLAIEGPTPRQRLAALFWPDSDAQAARNALRQRLFQLRRQLGVELVVGGELPALAAGVAHDLGDADTVLEGQACDFGPEVSAWLTRVRAQRVERARGRLQSQAETAERAHDWDTLLDLAHRQLALDPLREDAHRGLMRAHYLRGDRTAALLAFDACRRVLKDDVGIAPDAQTFALLKVITDAAPASPPRAVASMPASVLRPPRLIGRDAEMQALHDAWHARSVLLLAGEPGMGKTRLLSDLAAAHGPAAVGVSSRPGDHAVPFAVLARLLRPLLARASPLSPPAQRALASVVPELADAPGAPTPAAGAVVLHDAVEAVLHAAAAAGVAGILVDDLQYADAASVEALQGALASGARLGWQLAYRSGELSSSAHALVQQAVSIASTRSLALRPLARADIEALVDSLGVPGLSGAALAPSLWRHTGGNPMYLLETIKQMLLPGAAAASGAALPSAPGVVTLIGQRLAQLSPAALRLARCAAIAGQDFSVELAEQVLGAGPLDLADAWAELEVAQVLRDAAFAHDLIQEAALGSVPAALARRLHGRVAKELAQGRAPAARIAAHWTASDTPHAAVPHLLESGRKAASAMRPQEATVAFLAVADLLQSEGRHDEAFEALVSLFEAAYSPADAGTDAVLQRLDAMARTPLQRARVADRRADILARSGDFELGARIANAALSELDVHAHPALGARLLCMAASGNIAAGEVDRAIERMHRAMDLATRSGELETEALTAAAFGSVLDHAQRYVDGYLAHRRAYELALQRPQAPIELVSVAANIAGNRTAVGRFDTALEMCLVCYRVAGDAAIDLHEQWPSLRVHHAYSLMHLGDYAQAITLFEGARADIARYMPSWLPAVDNMLATLWIHLGQWARARQVVRASIDAAHNTLPRYRARALQLQAQIAAALHEPAARDMQVDAAAPAADVDRIALHQRGLAQSQALPPEDGLALACRLRDEAIARQMPNLVLEAEARCAQAAARAGRHAHAAAHAREALTRMRETSPTNLYRGEIWLAAAQGLEAEAPHERMAVLQEAVTWIRSTAAQRVPDPCRDSFLHRNPANLKLLQLAAIAR